MVAVHFTKGCLVDESIARPTEIAFRVFAPVGQAANGTESDFAGKVKVLTDGKAGGRLKQGEEEGKHHQGTGSHPPLEKGWQRRIRQVPMKIPRMAPCFSKASRVYVEQVGMKRHFPGPRKGLRIHR